MNTAGMTAGPHTIAVVAGDGVGNATTRSVTFTVHYSTATLGGTVSSLCPPPTPQR